MSDCSLQHNGNAPLEQYPRSKSLMIAGGTDGIGFALLALESRRSKYTKVFVLGRNFQKVDQLLEKRDVKSRMSVSQRIVKVRCNIRKLEEIYKTMEKIDNESIHDFVLTIGTFHRDKITDIMPLAAETNNVSPRYDDIVEDHFHANCVSTIHLIRLIVPKLMKGVSQILVCTASLAVMARSPYSLQSATKSALRAFVDTLRIELKGKTRVMNLMPPSVDTNIFEKAGDLRNTDGYPPPSRIATTMQFLLDTPFDICIPEVLVEQHHFEINPQS